MIRLITSPAVAAIGLGILLVVAGVNLSHQTALAGLSNCVTPTGVAASPTPDPVVPSGVQGAAVQVACTPTALVPNHTATPTITVTPKATNTSVPEPTSRPATPVPPAPTATVPSGGAGGAGISPPNTGSGPGSSHDAFAIGVYVAGIALMAGGTGSVLAGIRRKR